MSRSLEIKILTQLQDKLSAPLKRLQSTSKQTEIAFGVLKDRLRELNSQSRSIDTFKKLEKDLENTSNKLVIAKSKFDELNKQMQGTINPSAAMIAQLSLARQNVEKLTQKQTDQNLKLEETKNKLESAGISTKNLAAHEADLANKIKTTNAELGQHQAALQKAADIQQKFSEAKSKLANTQQFASNMAITGAAGIATGRTMLQPVKSAMSHYSEMENADTQLRVSMMGSDGKVSEEFQKVSDLATKLGDRLPGTTADFKNMMTMLKRQGMSDETIIGGLGESAAHMGVLLNLQVEQAAEFAAKMQDALQAPESEMLKITDGMQRMYYAGVDASNILSGFAKAAPALKTLGKSGHEAFQELGPMLAMFDQSGMDGAAAGNALRKVLQRSIDEKRLEDANSELKSYGVDFKLDFTDGKGEFGGVDHLFKELEKLKTLTSQQRNSVLKYLIGDDAETNQVITTLMTKGKAGYDEMANKLAAQASLDERINVQLNTLKNTMEAAEGSWTNAMAEIGKTAAEPLKDVINFFGELANKVAQFVRENPTLVGWLVKILVIVAAVITVFGGLAVVLASVIGPLAMMRYALSYIGIAGAGGVGVFGKLASAMGVVKTAVVAVGRALLMNPIGIAITVIASLAYLVYNNWDWCVAQFSVLSNWFGGLWETIKGHFQQAVDFITNIFWNWTPLGIIIQNFDSIKNWFTNLWSTITGFFTSGTSDANQALQSWDPLGIITQVFGAVTTWFTNLWSTITGFFTSGTSDASQILQNWNPLGILTSIFSGAGAIISTAFNGVSSAISTSIQTVSSTISSGIESVKNFASEKWKSVSQTASGLWNDVKGFFSSGTDKVDSEIQTWNLAQPFQSIWGGVSSFFTSKTAEMGTSGTQLVSGLVAGMRSQAEIAMEEARKLAAAISNSFKDAMQIRSPSRVFKALGAFIPEGAAVGIQKAQGLAVNAARTMAVSVTAAGAMSPAVAEPIKFDHRPALSVSTASRATPPSIAGDTINIHVHASQGQNAQDIARLVKQEIERLQAQKQARTRSSYTDYGY